MTAVTVPLHPDVEPLGFLIGHWSGTGAGEYSTIAPFSYHEEVRFQHVGKPFLGYEQRTTAVDDGRPLHAEVGYLRYAGEGRVEFVLAHPTGVVEVEEGVMEGTTLRLGTTIMASTATAKRVDRLERDLRVDGDRLTYEVRMAAVGEPLQHHLSATLIRQPSSP